MIQVTHSVVMVFYTYCKNDMFFEIIKEHISNFLASQDMLMLVLLNQFRPLFQNAKRSSKLRHTIHGIDPPHLKEAWLQIQIWHHHPISQQISVWQDLRSATESLSACFQLQVFIPTKSCVNFDNWNWLMSQTVVCCRCFICFLKYFPDFIYQHVRFIL